MSSTSSLGDVYHDTNCPPTVGIEKGFFHRISRAFKVVKRPTETENDDEGATAQGGEGNIAPGDEQDIAPSDEGDIALGDATGADTVPLIPVHRNTVAW